VRKVYIWQFKVGPTTLKEDRQAAEGWDRPGKLAREDRHGVKEHVDVPVPVGRIEEPARIQRIALPFEINTS
jgi:hypothetical protein